MCIIVKTRCFHSFQNQNFKIETSTLFFRHLQFFKHLWWALWIGYPRNFHSRFFLKLLFELDFFQILQSDPVRKTLKKGKENQNMKKSQTMWKKLYFVRKHIWKNLVYIVTFVLQFFLVAGSDKTPTLT